MKEHEIILKDLQEYLKKKGIETNVRRSKSGRLCAVVSSFIRSGYSFGVFDGHVCAFYSRIPIVSLADPKYKEKFVEYLEKG